MTVAPPTAACPRSSSTCSASIRASTGVERRVLRLHHRRVREVDGERRVLLGVVGAPLRLLNVALGALGVDALAGLGDVLVPGPLDVGPPAGDLRLGRLGLAAQLLGLRLSGRASGRDLLLEIRPCLAAAAAVRVSASLARAATLARSSDNAILKPPWVGERGERRSGVGERSSPTLRDLTARRHSLRRDRASRSARRTRSTRARASVCGEPDAADDRGRREAHELLVRRREPPVDRCVQVDHHVEHLLGARRRRTARPGSRARSRAARSRCAPSTELVLLAAALVDLAGAACEDEDRLPLAHERADVVPRPANHPAHAQRLAPDRHRVGACSPRPRTASRRRFQISDIRNVRSRNP